MPKRFYLNCLGVPLLRGPGFEPIRIQARKNLALLVYLAVEGDRPQSREAIYNLLWPTAQDAQGRQSLATALSCLRVLLGPGAIEANRETVRLMPDRIHLDLDRLVSGDLTAGPEYPELDLNGFLTGFDLPGCVEYHLWRDRQNAKWLPLIYEGLHRLIERARRSGNSREMERLADRLLSVDEMSEEGIRAKMESRALSGDRLTALRIYDDWSRRMVEELGATPSEMIEGLAIRLRRRGWERTTRVEIPHVPTDQWRDRLFVGRVREHQLLYDAWERARRGLPELVVVTGDSGIGKSTLAARLGTTVALEGASVTRAQGFELERAIPYAVLGALVRPLLDRPGAAATAPASLAELGRVIPEIPKRFEGLPGPTTVEGEAARIHIAEAFHALLLALLDEHPVLLIVDDAQLADEASLSVLHLALRRMEHDPIVVVVTWGPPPAAALRPEEAEARLQTLGGSTLRRQRVELPPLSDEESAQLLTALIPAEHRQPSFSERRILLRAAAGYPMALELAAQDWTQRGAESLALAVPAMTRSVAAAPSDYYRSLCDGILAHLDPSAAAVLRLAAVLDHRINDLSLYEIIDVSAGQAMSALSALSATRALRDTGNGLEFVNQIIRAHVYLSYPAQIRVILHGEVADRLIRRRGEGEDVAGLEIAWHCIRSGREAEAAPFLLGGAREAIRRGALPDAELALRTGLPSLGPEDRIEALVLLAEVLQEMSLWQDSLDVLVDIPKTTEARNQRVEVLTLYADAGLGRIDPGRLPHFTKRLIEMMTGAIDPSTRVLAAVAATMSDFVRQEPFRASIAASIHKIENGRYEDSDDYARIALAQARLTYFGGDVPESLARIETALASFGTAPPPNALTLSLNAGLTAIYSARTDFAKAHAQAIKTFGIALRIGNEPMAARQAANLSLFEYHRRNFASSKEWSKKALALGANLPGYFRVVSLAYHGLSCAHLGEEHAAYADFLTVANDFGDAAAAWISQAALLYAAEGFRTIGKEAAAINFGLQGTSGRHAMLHGINFAGRYAYWIVETLSRRADKTTAIKAVLALNAKLHQLDTADQVEVLLATSRVVNSANKAFSLRRQAKEIFATIDPNLIGMVHQAQLL